MSWPVKLFVGKSYCWQLILPCSSRFVYFITLFFVWPFSSLFCIFWILVDYTSGFVWWTRMAVLYMPWWTHFSLCLFLACLLLLFIDPSHRRMNRRRSPFAKITSKYPANSRHRVKLVKSWRSCRNGVLQEWIACHAGGIFSTSFGCWRLGSGTFSIYAIACPFLEKWTELLSASWVSSPFFGMLLAAPGMLWSV